eukprot:TRINITY_DN41996_c0_g1_i1.p1 TRINITY_DN41996_c0_g1~~TRINITY_DN41996_c0_g1_i1.p1  ORF type:complete len:405 (+),score=76.84 TRINITY_DN41996_c0_g1_i1:171-1385(+)
MNGASFSELALDAWADCQPAGYLLGKERLTELLPQILRHLPPERARQKEEFFLAHEDKPAVFVSLARPHDEQVHFLYFWRAFCEVACLGEDDKQPAGLTCEIELFRDHILDRFEAAAELRKQSASEGETAGKTAQQPGLFAVVLPADAIAEELKRIADNTESAAFWENALTMLRQISAPPEHGGFTLDEVACVLLSWLHDAAAWEHRRRQEALGDGITIEADRSHAGRSGSKQSAGAAEAGLLVKIHIYDVSQEDGIRKLNRILAHKKSPIKLGGVFHAGVEVNGLEWSYGFSDMESRPGISCVEPTSHPQHRYRQTVTMRCTNIPPEDIADIISSLIEEYPGHDYDLLRRNCCHFADDFCKRLGVGSLPGWVYRLARIGATVDNLLQAAPQPVTDRIYNLLTP